MSTDALTPLIPEVLPPLTGLATVRLVQSPVRAADGTLRMVIREVPVGQTIADALPDMHVWTRVIWNGRVLRTEEQQRVVLAEGDEVTAFPTWGIEASWVPFLIYAAVGLAVSVAATAISYALAPSPRPHINQPIEEPTFSFDGIRTAFGPGNVVPVIYGRYRVGGQLLSGKVDQALTIIDAPTPVVPNPSMPIDNVYGGTLTPEATVGALITVVAPFHNCVTGTLVSIQGVTGKYATNGSWYVTLVDPHTVTLQGSAGIDANPYTGGGTLTIITTTAAGSRRVDAVAAPSTMTMLLALGEGPVSGIQPATIELNGQPLANFPGVLFYQRLGTPDQTPMPEFGENAFTFPVGAPIPVLPGIAYTTTTEVNAFVLNISFQQGLFHLTTTGEKQENVSTLGYRYRPHPAGTWTNFSFFDVAASRTSVVRFGIRREGLPFGVYDIEVAWSHAREVHATRSKWEPTLDAVTEIVSNSLAYPNTALMGLKSVSTEALQGALPNVTVELLGKAVRVNEFLPNFNWTQNPAWCVMDLMTDKRYGMGVPDSQIDLGAFSAWANYCAEIIDGEPRHQLNYVLDREQRAQAAVLEICHGSRTLMLKSGGLWSPRPTRDVLPVQLLSWANVTNVELTFTRDPDEINVMEARYANEEDQFQQDVLSWPPIGQWPAVVHKASLDLRGVTKPTRVMRALQFELNRRRFELLALAMDCALDAMILEPHDVFKFSHPDIGWGKSGRVRPGSTVHTVFLDEEVTFEAGKQYHLHLRFDFDAPDIKPCVNPGPGSYTYVTMAVDFAQQPDPDVTLWAFGESTPVDTAVKLFRVVRLQRKSDTTVHLEAIEHNPSIYNEPTAAALPPISSLFNPLGPPPPLISLVAMEVVRVQAGGESLRVVDLSWDVAALSAGFAPYGGAAIYRRTVLLAGQAGQAQAGSIDYGAILDPNDPNVNFVRIAQVRGHVLDYDDGTVITGTNYIYRVVPVSGQGVPNNTGMKEVQILVAGPNLPAYFPGTVKNLRLKGQPPGSGLFEGRDVHIEWDPLTDSPLFSSTFFVVSYTVEVWAPGQLYLLRRTTVTAGPTGQTMQWTYTQEQNTEDQVKAGQKGARRDLLIYVYANTNTGLSSITPATIQVYNPPPDMSTILPDVSALFEAAWIDWGQYAEPRDFHHYTVYLDTVVPPVKTYQDTGIAFRRLSPVGLTPHVTYYTYIMPHDTFGPGIPTQIVSFVPASFGDASLDTIPPGTPTGLALTTGTTRSQDGTIVPWVQASWNLNPEADVGGYEVQFRVGDNPVPSVFQVGRTPPSARLESVPGNVTIFAKVAAFDKVHNISPFTAEVSISTATDTVPPAAPTNLTAIGSIKSVNLLWTPPPDVDYAYSQVWAGTTNDRNEATQLGQGSFSFHHEGLGPADTYYYWLRAVDTSGNVSTAYHPASATAGVAGTSGQLDTTFISSLAADKLIAGTITALVRVGVNNITIDGVSSGINVFDQTGQIRTQMGKLGTLSTDWGLRLFNSTGQVMWNFTTGAQTAGIADQAVNAAKIRVGELHAGHMRADIAVVDKIAQIANALIVDAHISQLSANKVKAGRFDGVYFVGEAPITSIVLDAPNHLITVFDNQNTPQARVLLGRIVPGGTNIEYGLQIFNAAGGLMWNFTDGAQTLGIADLAVTNAKIVNLTADKITTGSLLAHYSVGVGIAITIDGPNQLMTFRDASDNVRVFLGKVGASYGLQVFNSAGQIMWDFTDGASTQGIKLNAVTANVTYASNPGTQSVGAEAQVALLPFGALPAQAVIWLLVTCTAVMNSGTEPITLTIRFREDSLSGTILVANSITNPGIATPMTMQILWQAPTALGGKNFVFTLQLVGGTGNVEVQQIGWTGMVFKR